MGDVTLTAFLDAAGVEPRLTIGEVAQLSCVPATTLRYYESVGLRAIIAWGMQCTCPTIDDCTCGIHVADRTVTTDR